MELKVRSNSENQNFVYLRSLERKSKLGVFRKWPAHLKNMVTFVPNEASKLECIAPPNTQFLKELERHQNPVAIVPHGIWAVDYRTLIYRIMHTLESYSTIVSKETLHWAFNRAMVLHLHPPLELLETTGLSHWRTVVIDDAPIRTEEFYGYWRHRVSIEGQYQEPFKYKDGRAEKPKRWYEIFDAGLEAIKARNYPYLSVEGYEADDIFGYLTHPSNRSALVAKGMKCFVINTVDSDLLQLVSDPKVPQQPEVLWYNVLQYQPRLRSAPEALEYWKRREKVDLSSVREIVDHKALKGDSADSIPKNSHPGFIDLWEPLVGIPTRVAASLMNTMFSGPIELKNSSTWDAAVNDMLETCVIYEP